MRRLLLFGAFLLLGSSPTWAQSTTSITPDDFKKMSKTWSEVGGITLDPFTQSYKTVDGEGVLVNLPVKKKGEDIYTEESYGDFDLSIEYMMFPGSNSGIYLHGRYEVQLFDSWRKLTASSGDNGGIYKRYSEEAGREVDGYPPRQNASRAPGLWQKLQISFQAPRFDESGKKTANARLIRVVLNGVEIHQDVELFGPTGGAVGAEAPRGPLRIQGDHGAVAFRNMQITTFDNPTPELSNVTYRVYEGMFTEMPNFEELTPIAEGSTEVLTPSVSPLNNGYLIHYSGSMNVKSAGMYNFTGNFNAGGGAVLIDGQPVIGITEWAGTGSVELAQGDHDVQVYYAKFYEWAPAGLRFMVNGPGIRDVSFHDENVNMVSSVDPIYREAPSILRSFMDISDDYRVTRAVSVGTAEGVHYTYDMDHGTLVHAWRGGFIDATPMWNSRGDGSSRPRGAVTVIDGVDLLIRSEGSLISSSDTVGTSFKARGYTLASFDTPQFMYDVDGHRVVDHIRVLPDGSGFARNIGVDAGAEGMKFRLGSGKTVTTIEDGLLRVNDDYYIKFDPGLKVEINAEGDSQSVWVNLTDKLSYEIIF